MKKRVAILISGRGSNMKALIEASLDKDYPAIIALVISNIPEAGGLKIAESHGVKTLTLPSKGKTREALEAEMQKALIDNNIDIVCLAGFMRLLTADFVNQWQGKMLNIHPALLPKFKGLDTHKRALEAGETHHGATVHYVSPEMDEGEIILQEAIKIMPQDDEKSLAIRVLAVENRLYPKALRLVISTSPSS
jgi:phosphoribosylglycinamide formyltransferase-1